MGAGWEPDRDIGTLEHSRQMWPCFPAISVAVRPTQRDVFLSTAYGRVRPPDLAASPALLRVLLSGPDSAFLPLPSLCGVWGLLEVGTSQLALCSASLVLSLAALSFQEAVFLLLSTSRGYHM